MGSALMGSLQISCFLTEGVLPLTYLYIPKSSSSYLFPQSVKIDYFCSGPISVDPVCPQPNDSSHTSIRPTEVCLWWQLSARQLSGAR